MHSRLYECRVMHHRFQPKVHHFSYRVFMLGLDLDELPGVQQRLRLLSINRRNVYSFFEDDYLPLSAARHRPARGGFAAEVSPGATLRERLAAWLAQHGVALGAGRVELVTIPRILGYQFNPVSFYLCREFDGRPLAAVAEVTNTFRETKLYFLGPPRASDGSWVMRVPKHFYVSPFSDVDVEFAFILRPHPDRLSVQIDDYAGGRRTLTSTLHGPARPLNDRRLVWFLVKYPLLTLQVIARIHWHALRLYLKRVPWHRKAARPEDQRDVLRPHASLLGVSSPHA